MISPTRSDFFVLVLSFFLVVLALALGWQLGRGGLSLGEPVDDLLLGKWPQATTTVVEVVVPTSTPVVVPVDLPAVFMNGPECNALLATSSGLLGDWSLDKPLECRLAISLNSASTTVIIKKDVARTVPGFSFPKYVVEIYNPVTAELAQRIKIDPGLSEERNNFSPEFFNIRDDVNFDGYRDAFVLDNLGAANQFGGWWLYNAITGKFEKNDQLSVLANPKFSAIDRTIETYVSNGAAGCLFERMWFKFEDGHYREVKREEQTSLISKNGSQFRRVLEIYERNRWRVASTTVLSSSNCYQ